MLRPMIRIHNQETNEIIEREMNDEEYAAHQDFVSNQPVVLTDEEIDAKLQAKKELFDRLGITEEEAKLLLS